MVSNQCADNVDQLSWLNISNDVQRVSDIILINQLQLSDHQPFLNLPEVPRVVDKGVLSSTQGECSPSVEAELEPPSPPPSDAGIQLRYDRDFTDGEAMVQEHLMSS